MTSFNTYRSRRKEWNTIEGTEITVKIWSEPIPEDVSDKKHQPNRAIPGRYVDTIETPSWASW